MRRNAAERLDEWARWLASLDTDSPAVPEGYSVQASQNALGGLTKVRMRRKIETRGKPGGGGSEPPSQ